MYQVSNASSQTRTSPSKERSTPVLLTLLLNTYKEMMRQDIPSTSSVACTNILEKVGASVRAECKAYVPHNRRVTGAMRYPTPSGPAQAQIQMALGEGFSHQLPRGSPRAQSANRTKAAAAALAGSSAVSGWHQQTHR